MTGRGGILADAKYPFTFLRFRSQFVGSQADNALLAPQGQRHTHLLLANTKFNNNTSTCVCSRQTCDALHFGNR